jgi:hypothetical protein
MNSYKNKLINSLELSCQCSYSPNIEKGRNNILKLPRQYVLKNIEQIACKVLNIDDEWEFRRFLELLLLLGDVPLIKKNIEIGLKSRNTEIVETSNDFLKKI